MTYYAITEEELDKLATLNPEWPEEARERDELVAKIRLHPHIAVELEADCQAVTEIVEAINLQRQKPSSCLNSRGAPVDDQYYSAHHKPPAAE